MTTSTARRPLSTEAVIDRMTRRLVKAGKDGYVGYTAGYDAVVSTPCYFVDPHSVLILDNAHGAPVSDRNIYELAENNMRIPAVPEKYSPLTGTGSHRVDISVNLLNNIVRANGGRKLDNIVPVYVGNDTYCNGVYLLDIVDALRITDDIIPVYVYQRERTSMPLICVYGYSGERGALLPIRYSRDCNPYTPAGDITLLPGLSSKRAQITALIDNYRMYNVPAESYVDRRSYCTFGVPVVYYNAAENMPREMSLCIVDTVNLFAHINALVSRTPGLAFELYVTLHRPGRDIDTVNFTFVLDGREGSDSFDNTAFDVVSSAPDFKSYRFWGAYNSERMIPVMAARRAAAAQYVKSTAVVPAITAPAYKPAVDIVKPAPVAAQTAVNAPVTAPAIDTPAAPAGAVKPVVSPVHAAAVKPVYVHIVPAVVPAIRVPAVAGCYTFDRAVVLIPAARPGTSAAALWLTVGAGYTPRSPYTRTAIDTYSGTPTYYAAPCTPDYKPPRISPAMDVYAAYMARGIDTPPRALTPLTGAYSPVHAAGAAGGYMAGVDTAAPYTPPTDCKQGVPPAGDYSPDNTPPVYTRPDISETAGGRYTPPITEPPGGTQSAHGGRGARPITPAAGVPPIMSPPPYNGRRGANSPYNDRPAL
jgi:hypothetical protein